MSASTTPGRATGRRTSPSQRPCSRSSAGSPMPRSGSTTTTSTSRRGSSATRRPEALLSHFVHIPWPGPDYWTRAAGAGEACAIHEGLLANDVVGFHTDRWRENFLVSAARILGAEVDRELGTVEHDGRRTLVTAHPISVDPAEFDELAGSDGGARRRSATSSEIRGERLIVRVDRTDPSKNIVRGFQAFEVYLERHPEARAGSGCSRCSTRRGRTSRSTPRTSRRFESAARAVNERFGSDGWQPIVLEIRDDFPRSRRRVQAVRRPVRERDLRRDEPGRQGGAARQRAGRRARPLRERRRLRRAGAEWSLVVNPFDVAGQAEAIHDALELPRRTSAARGSRRSARTCASTTSTAGSSAQLPTSTGLGPSRRS